MTFKIFLIISLVVNSILIATITGLLPFLLFLSILIIGSLIWYIKKLLIKIDEFDADLEIVYDSIYDLAEHLRSLHEMEMFYGEPTLQALIAHSGETINIIYDYQEKYFSLKEDPEEMDNNDNYQENEEKE